MTSRSDNPQKTIVDSTILIVGIVRDVEKTIMKDYLRMSESFSNFRHGEWFLFESDSQDRCTDMLN